MTQIVPNGSCLGSVRKIQCDGEKPACWHCKARHSECIYEPEQRRRGLGKARKGSRPKKVGHRPSVVIVEEELDAMPADIRLYMTVWKT